MLKRGVPEEKNSGSGKSWDSWLYSYCHAKTKGDTMDIEIAECDEGKEVEVTEWIWNQKQEQEDWKGVEA